MWILYKYGRSGEEEKFIELTMFGRKEFVGRSVNLEPFHNIQVEVFLVPRLKMEGPVGYMAYCATCPPLEETERDTVGGVEERGKILYQSRNKTKKEFFSVLTACQVHKYHNSLHEVVVLDVRPAS